MSRFADLFQEVPEIASEPKLEKKLNPKPERELKLEPEQEPKPEPELIVPEDVIVKNSKPADVPVPPQQPKTFALD